MPRPDGQNSRSRPYRLGERRGSTLGPVSGPGDDEVGTILAECTELLAELREEFRGDPLGEYRRLVMLALEREQLVSYAYREEILAKRLAQLVAPVDVVGLLNHAFTQLWRDEEAHTVLTRAALLERGRGTGLTRASIEQAAGWLAGWSSALKHHVPRSSAPLRSLMVDGLSAGARMVGKLSPDLRAELRLKSFRDFCLYNIDAEETAELCWQRLIELERELHDVDTELFERIAREEREHRDVFELVARSLDEHDWLRPGVGVDELVAGLSKIDARFVPRRDRPDHRHELVSDDRPATGRPIARFGEVGPVLVAHESTFGRDDAIAEAVKLLGDVSGLSVAIQASWMMGYSSDDRSSVVDPRLIEVIVGLLTDRGAGPIVLLDGENLYSSIFHNRSVEEVAKHFGLDGLGCPVLDGTSDVVPLTQSIVLGPAEVSRAWVEADVRLSVVRLRSHPTEHLHASTANLESLVPGHSENVFYRRRYDHSVAALAVAAEAPPHLAIIDAWQDCPDGLFGLMAGSHVVHPGRLYASTDALACDLIALKHTGSGLSVNSPTLRRAVEWFGDRRHEIEVVGVDSAIEDWTHPYDNPFSGFLADLSYPVFSYLSGAGALFAPLMDDVFTERAPLPSPLRLVRSVARLALGLRPPRS